MQIERLPLTRNGKLDKKMLPNFEIHQSRDIVTPTSKEQVMVTSIFEKILGIDNLSIKDTFFELGGDSIKAIRAVSKIREAGYQITVKDIIKKQTVEAIAATAIPIDDSQNEEKEVYGVVINTPIIQEFIDRNLAIPEHFNHSVMIKVDTVVENVLIQVLDKLYEHHDILRSVLKNGQLEIMQTRECKKYDFQVYDLRDSEQYYDEIEMVCNQNQKSMDLKNGPLIKTVFFLTNQGNYLMICIHHLVIDGVSWRILLEDFNTAINLTVMKKEIRLPKKTNSYITWAQALQEYKSSHIYSQEYNYWKNIVSDMKAVLPFHVKKNPVKGYDTKDIILKTEETYQLFYEAPKSFNTEAGDLLLCALAVTMKQVFAVEHVIVGLEGHGREEINKVIKIDRTIGWFTSKYPVMLNYREDMQCLIVETKEMLRSIPNHGMSYGLMKEQLEKPTVNLYFNYLGMSESTEESCPFSTGDDVARENDIEGLIVLNSIVEAGKLIVSVVYDKENIQEDIILLFLREYKKNISDMIHFCMIQHESIVTASDCAQTDLSMEDFSSITEFMSSGFDM
jgi:non-ribosomal peptide synthase protein (TIGR01720 family)